MDDKYLEIFVGRERDLELMSTRFENRLQNRGPPKVYSYLNAPGIGKTTLLQRFGDMIEQEGRGMHLYFSCRGSYRSENMLGRDIIEVLAHTLQSKNDMILRYIETNRVRGFDNRSKYQKVVEKIDELLEGEPNLGDVAEVLSTLTNIVPLLFSTDEIQQLQRIQMQEGRTLLRSYAQFLADLLPRKIFLVISGTQYRIMSQIGYGIGSPLNGKIQPVVLSPLRQEDMEEYMRRFAKLYPGAEYLPELEIYLKSFSGGHPRTIEKIVEAYFSRGVYSDFVEELTPIVERILSHSLLDDEKINALKSMEAHEKFPEVKKWILQGMTNNLVLTEYQGIEDLIYDLMTLGIVVQNGNFTYRITSYFHALTFLEALTGQYEGFLQQVLDNKYFRKIVRGTAGLGFTFEHILFYSLILKQLRSPFDVGQLSSINVIRGKSLPDDIKAGVLYHLPLVKGIDGAFRSGGEVILVQITTQKSTLRAKLREFEETVKNYGQGVRGWFVSLYRVDDGSSVEITSGEDLIDLLGEKIYQRIREIKDSLRLQS